MSTDAAKTTDTESPFGDCYSANEEEFDFSSYQEAAQYLWELGDLEIGGTVVIWEGEAVKHVASVFVPTMADLMQEMAYDEGGEYSERWEFTRDEKVSLQTAVENAVDEWATANDKHPNFYGVRNVKPITVRFTTDEGDCEIA